MRERLRSNLTYANVMVTILAFIVIGGGTATAALVVSSNSEVGPDTIAGHHLSRAYHANIISGSVTGADLASSSVTGSDLSNDSITQLDIAGTDVSGTINIPAMPPNFCTDGQLTVPGAKVGDVALFSLTGNGNLPLRVIVESIKVPVAGKVAVRICNPTGIQSGAAQGLGIRVLTLR
jgi:hypothetical protein